MNFLGLLHGVVAFLLIGIFHPFVIKAEYYLGRKAKLMFLSFGILGLLASLFTKNMAISTNLGIFAFCSFWSIKEVIEQEDRVKDGRFPRNPNRKYDY